MNSAPNILHPLSIDLRLSDLIEKLTNTPGGEKIVDKANQVFQSVDQIWKPRATYRWLKIDRNDKGNITLYNDVEKITISLELGHSAQFLDNAEQVLAGVYSTGSELEEAAMEATRQHKYIDGFIIEQLNLTLLDKTAAVINKVVEEEASEKNWGVGPLLSPGSVHGWELTDQPDLCGILPLSQINIECSKSGVLSPFNSLSFIIGIGPGYSEKKVGPPCDVCSNREKCEMRTK